ncbi:MAG: acyl-CoA dehydrogenase, partial [Dehalococcoidia bacterium]|nr:acyl-CoA dehydrogenase [Dehalococcoidia bacterium]
MAIDFKLAPDVEQVRQRVRSFMESRVRPVEERLVAEAADRSAYRQEIGRLRDHAREEGLWNPHLPAEWGGMALGPVAMAFVSAEAGRTTIGPYVLNAQAPDEGNMHTLLHHANDEQKEKYLRPLAEGRCRSCFAMTEPEVAGSDPTLIQTSAIRDGDDWIVNGHKWFISGARGARFAILVAKTDPDADPPQARNSAFLVDLPSEGWEVVRDIETMAGHGNHCEIRITDLRVASSQMLSERGHGHLLGQARLGPA